MKWALVTGASCGIGEEFCRQISKSGYSLVMTARREGHLKKLQSELSFMFPNQRFEIFPCDLSLENSPHDLYSFCKSKEIFIEFLINNAGFGSCGYFDQLPLKTELKMIDLNIRSLVAMTHIFVQEMKNKRVGKVLQVASCAAFQPGPGMSVYFATKAFVLHFSEALQKELENSGIVVQVLCPGTTKTEFFDVAGADVLADSKLIFQMSAKDVVSYSLKYSHTILIPGFWNRLLSYGYRLFPRTLLSMILKKILIGRVKK